MHLPRVTSLRSSICHRGHRPLVALSSLYTFKWHAPAWGDSLLWWHCPQGTPPCSDTLLGVVPPLGCSLLGVHLSCGDTALRATLLLGHRPRGVPGLVWHRSERCWWHLLGVTPSQVTVSLRCNFSVCEGCHTCPSQAGTILGVCPALELLPWVDPSFWWMSPPILVTLFTCQGSCFWPKEQILGVRGRAPNEPSGTSCTSG